MGYINKTKDGRWGMPVGLLALILGLVLFGGLTGPIPALADAISCGQCHSNPPRDDDGCLTPSKGHPAHTQDRSTCNRCHPTYSDPGHPDTKHNNNVVNFTSVIAPGMSYNTTNSTCTNACHRNKPEGAWGGRLTCNSCHFRSDGEGSVQMSGLHVEADRAWKHYSSPIKVIDNTQTITCSNCHPVFENQTAAPRAHIATGVFEKRANMDPTETFQNVTVTGIGYTKGPSQGTGTCTLSCHYNVTDLTNPFANRTIYFKPGMKRWFGGYSTARWSDEDLKCNECHSTPGQQATYQNGSGIQANKRHNAHMFKYKLNPFNFQNEDRNIYCDDCHKTPDPFVARGFLNHSTYGKNDSGVISLPVKSQYSKVYLGWRNNNKGRDNVNPATYNRTTNNCGNVYCHTIMTDGTWTEEACDSCHGRNNGVDIGSGAPGYSNLTSSQNIGFDDYSGGGGAHYSHVMMRGYPCRTCHFDGGGDGDPLNHHNINRTTIYKGYVEVGVQPQYWFNNQTSKYSRVTRACNNVKCHYGASQNWDCTPLH